jgi:hypothetical protein
MGLGYVAVQAGEESGMKALLGKFSTRAALDLCMNFAPLTLERGFFEVVVIGRWRWWFVGGGWRLVYG